MFCRRSHSFIYTDGHVPHSFQHRNLMEIIFDLHNRNLRICMYPFGELIRPVAAVGKAERPCDVCCAGASASSEKKEGATAN